MRVTAILRRMPDSYSRENVYWVRDRRHGKSNASSRRRGAVCLRGFGCRVCGHPFDFSDESGRLPKIRHRERFAEMAVDKCVGATGEKLVCYDCMWELTGRRRMLGSTHAADAVAAYAYLREYERWKASPPDEIGAVAKPEGRSA